MTDGQTQLDSSDITAAWCGIRPLARYGHATRKHLNLPDRDPSVESTEAISRDHVVYVAPSGLITITGGKVWGFDRK